jgi:DNA-binding GntR family transcriptional regulator
MNSLLQVESLEGAESQSGVRAINRHHGLAEEAYEAIFAQLMALRIAPGSRITVDNLAREFNVSQTPIREALGRLEARGWSSRPI